MACSHKFGPDYIIPAPFDPRLMEVVPVRGRQGGDGLRAWRPSRSSTSTPIASRCARGSTRPPRCSRLVYEGARAHPKRVIFAEAEEEVVLRAAIQFRDVGYGTPVLVGRDDVRDKLRELGVERSRTSFEIHNSRNSPLVPQMVDFLYERLQRRGYLRRDVRADGQSGPQHLRRAAARAGPGRCDDHRRHPHLCADDARGPPGARSRGRAHCRSASTC